MKKHQNQSNVFFKKFPLEIHFRRKVMTLNIIHKTAITDANTPTSLNRFSITQIKNLTLELQKTSERIPYYASLKN